MINNEADAKYDATDIKLINNFCVCRTIKILLYYLCWLSFPNVEWNIFKDCLLTGLSSGLNDVYYIGKYFEKAQLRFTSRGVGKSFKEEYMA